MKMPWLVRIGAVLAALFCLALSQPRVRADITLAEPLGLLAEALDARGNVADRTIEAIGFEIDVPRDVWTHMPTVRKLETLYLRAERASQGGGGRFLALLSRHLAQSHEWVSADPVLRGLAARVNLPPDATASDIRMAATTPVRLDLPPLHKAAIVSLAEHIDAGGLTRLLRVHFDVGEDRLYDILGQSSSNADALARALGEVPELERARVFRAAVADMAEVAPGLREHEAIATFLLENPPDPAQGMGGGPSPPNGGPNGGPDRRPDSGPIGGPNRRGPIDHSNGRRYQPPAGSTWRTVPVMSQPSVVRQTPELPRSVARSSAQTYPRFLSRHYTHASRAFADVTRRAAGWGGVVLGNDVRPLDGIAAPERVFWVPDPIDPSRGLLRIVAENEVLSCGPVLAEDVRAARHILVDGITDGDGRVVLTRHRDGDAIGLVSLDLESRSEYLDWPPDHDPIRGKRWDLVLHPALEDTDLGWSVIMCDVLMIAGELLVDEANSRGATESEAASLESLRTGRAGNWKVTDRPMGIRVRSGAVEAVPIDRDGEPLVGTAAFQAVGFRADAEDDAFHTLFEEASEALLRRTNDFARLDRFIRTLSVLRWCVLHDAKLVGQWPDPALIGTPEAIVVCTDAVFPAPSLDANNAISQNAGRALVRIGAAGHRMPTLRGAMDEVRAALNESLGLQDTPDDGASTAIANERLERAVTSLRLRLAPDVATRDLVSRERESLIREHQLAEQLEQATEAWLRTASAPMRMQYQQLQDNFDLALAQYAQAPSGTVEESRAADAVRISIQRVEEWLRERLPENHARLWDQFMNAQEHSNQLIERVDAKYATLGGRGWAAALRYLDTLDDAVR